MNLFFIRDVKLIQEYKIRSKFYKVQVKHEKFIFGLVAAIMLTISGYSWPMAISVVIR